MAVVPIAKRRPIARSSPPSRAVSSVSVTCSASHVDTAVFTRTASALYALSFITFEPRYTCWSSKLG